MNDIIAIIEAAHLKLLKRQPRDEEVMLLLGTAAAESAFVHRFQLGGGPARGLWQMEPKTASDIFLNYLIYRKRYYWRVMRALYKRRYWLPFFRVPTRSVLAGGMGYNDLFACIMARIHYVLARQSPPHPFRAGEGRQEDCSGGHYGFRRTRPH